MDESEYKKCSTVTQTNNETVGTSIKRYIPDTPTFWDRFTPWKKKTKGGKTITVGIIYGSLPRQETPTERLIGKLSD